MVNRFALIGLSLITVVSNEAFAQTSSNGQVNTITTAVPFLRISPDARSGGMGDVGIALSPDANAQYWNLAKLPFTTKKFGVAVTYTPWLKDLVPDIWLGYISGYAKFGQDENQTISASLRYFNLGDINFTDINANPVGTGKPREYSFDVGYARKLSPYLSTGLNLRYINSSLATGFSGSGSEPIKPGNAVAADLGVFYTRTNEISEFQSDNFSFGAILSNVGSKISYNATRKDFIPINLGIGASYTKSVDEYNKITFGLDINKLLVPTPQDSTGDGRADYIPDKSVVSGMLGSFNDAQGGFSEEMREFQISIGAEYWYQDQFAVRAGYFYEDKTKGDRKYLTVGMGVKLNIFTLNGAYLVPSGSGVNRNPLSNTFRFSLLFDFDKLEKKESTTE
jgi:hypothetical protein